MNHHDRDYQQRTPPPQTPAGDGGTAPENAGSREEGTEESERKRNSINHSLNVHIVSD